MTARRKTKHSERRVMIMMWYEHLFGVLAMLFCFVVVPMVIRAMCVDVKHWPDEGWD